MRDFLDLEKKEGWRQFVKAEELLRPPRWSRADHEAASPEARARYDEERRVYHGGFGPVLHDRAVVILEAMMHQLELNRYANDLPLVGLVLDGDSFLGKSVLLKTLLWLYDRKYGRTDDVEIGLNDHCAVVNTSLVSDAKVVNINAGILDFLGAPLPPRARYNDLRRPVKDAVVASGVEVIGIDELNFLKKQYARHAVVNDHLKWMMNTLPATLVFAGVNCSETDLVTAAQTTRRLKVFTVEPFRHDDDDSKREWERLLGQVEGHLLLLDAPDGMLSGDAAMRANLYRRSSGSIGTLLSLVRGAAQEAITTGVERIDIPLLKTVMTERGAQDEEARRLAAQRRSGATPKQAKKRRSSRGPVQVGAS